MMTFFCKDSGFTIEIRNYVTMLYQAVQLSLNFKIFSEKLWGLLKKILKKSTDGRNVLLTRNILLSSDESVL
jgi:hypothetical protein